MLVAFTALVNMFALSNVCGSVPIHTESSTLKHYHIGPSISQFLGVLNLYESMFLSLAFCRDSICCSGHLHDYGVESGVNCSSNYRNDSVELTPRVFALRKSMIQWECDHGGYLYGATPDQYVGGVIPRFSTGICRYGVNGLYTVVVVSVIVDLGFQVGDSRIFSPSLAVLRRTIVDPRSYSTADIYDVLELAIFETIAEICRTCRTCPWR